MYFSQVERRKTAWEEMEDKATAITNSKFVEERKIDAFVEKIKKINEQNRELIAKLLKEKEEAEKQTGSQPKEKPTISHWDYVANGYKAMKLWKWNNKKEK